MPNDITQKNIAKGVDQHSSLTNIQEGWSESIVNMDTNSSGYLSTRKGYELHYGEIPLRITQASHIDDKIRFTLHSAQVLDLSTTSAGPIIVQGKLQDSSAAGDFTTTNALQYYTTWTLVNRDTLVAGANTLTRSLNSHGLNTNYIWAGTARSTSNPGSDNYEILPDNIEINKTTKEVTVDLTAASSGDAFLYLNGMASSPGVVHIETITAVSSVSIPASTHQLDNFFIQVKCFSDDGTSLNEEVPNTVAIDSSGQVDITFGGTFTGVATLVSTELTFDGQVSAELPVDGQAVSGTNTITIPTPGSAYNFYDVYALSGGTYNRVIPNKITYNETADEVEIEYFLAAGAESVSVYYTNSSISNNILEVTDNSATSESYIESTPQLTLWGISHASIYKSDTNRGGHVSHLDGYKRAGESRLVAGLGGNLFASRARGEVSAVYTDGDAFMPSYFLNMSERTQGAANVAPLFQATSSGVTRTRGLIEDDTISNNMAVVTAATYVSAGVMDYTLTFDAAATFSGKYGANDIFTITGMPYSSLNGSFSISSIAGDGTTEVVLRIANSEAATRLTTTGCGGAIGCFTDEVVMENTPEFVEDDALSYSSSGAATGLTVSSFSGTSVIVAGVDAAYALADGLKLSVTRTSSTVFTKVLAGTETIDNIVAGDKITIGSNSRSFKVKSVNTSASSMVIDESISITDDEVVAVQGRWWPIEVPEHTNNLAKTTYIAHFDENEYEDIDPIKSTMINDNMYFTNKDDEVMKFDGDDLYRAGLPRWQPLAFSNVKSAGGVVPNIITLDLNTNKKPFSTTGVDIATDIITLVAHEYAEETKVRLVTSDTAPAGLAVATDYYIINNTVDGIQLSASAGGSAIDITDVGVGVHGLIEVASSGNRFNISESFSAATFPIGARIFDGRDSTKYLIQEIDTTNNYVYVTETISDTSIVESPTIGNVATYRNYFKLNMIDANNNVVASAATSYQDALVELTEASDIEWKLIGMPAFDKYNYDRIEIQHFRTIQDAVAPFYLVSTQALSFDTNDTYTTLLDTAPDITLREPDTNLEGAELATHAQQPIRAGFMTTSNNRLILGDLKSYPQFDMVFNRVGGASALDTSDLDGIELQFDTSYTQGGIDYTDLANYLLLDITSADIRTPSAPVSNGGDLQVTVSGADVANATWVYMHHAAVADDDDITYCGWYKVKSRSTTSLTLYADWVSGAAVPDTLVVSDTAGDIPVWLGADGNFGTKATASVISTATLRLSMAINAVSRTTVKGSTNPIMTAGSGNDFGSGQLLITQPISGVDGTTLTITNTSTKVNIFVQNLLRTNGAVVDSDVLLFPGRVIQSYENFPEVFDNPAVAYDRDSLGVRDINAADGQSLVGGLGFFSDSTFGSGRLNDSVVLFKENSVYVYNTTTLEYQKLDTRGLGCGAPKSITTTRNGIMFANASGIYRLNRDLTVSYVGEKMQRIWRDIVNKGRLAEVVGHQYRTGRLFKLSIPVGTDNFNSEVLAYNHDAEGQGTQYGAWTTYNQHNATMWANLDDDAFFGAHKGQVYRMRTSEDASEFRDDEASIPIEWKSRAEDFGAAGKRKVIHKAFLELQLDHTDITAIVVSSRMDLSGDFTGAGTITETQADNTYIPVRLSLANRKGVNVQLKVTHDVINEEVVITGLSWSIDGLESQGIPEAADY